IRFPTAPKPLPLRIRPARKPAIRPISRNTIRCCSVMIPRIVARPPRPCISTDTRQHFHQSGGSTKSHRPVVESYCHVPDKYAPGEDGRVAGFIGAVVGCVVGFLAPVSAGCVAGG